MNVKTLGGNKSETSEREERGRGGERRESEEGSETH